MTAILCQQTTMTFNSVTVGGIKSITGIGSGTASEIDITTLDSTAKEFAQGLRDFGSIEVDLVRDQDDLGQVEMFNSMASQSTETIVVTLPSSTANVITFSGFVQSLSSDISADGVVMGKAKIRITGAIAFS
jgi:hypothetical protein